jgi:hypothetical protein
MERVRVRTGRIGLLIVMLPLSPLLSACLHEPLPYSPNYSRVTLVDPPSTPSRPGKVQSSTRQAREVVVPDACLAPDVAEQPVYLPSGCANNLNLQLMVERPQDLVEGRRSGPAAAAPTVRAAQRYLYGGTEAERRAGRLEQPRDQPAAPSLPQGTRP